MGLLWCLLSGAGPLSGTSKQQVTCLTGALSMQGRLLCILMVTKSYWGDFDTLIG